MKVIYVFANSLTKLKKMAEEYDIVVVGTSSPGKLQETMKSANDASQFFFVITDRKELDAVNKMFGLLLPDENNSSINLYTLIHKPLSKKLIVGNNKVLVREFEDLTENFIIEFLLSVAVRDQPQYFYKGKKSETPILTPDKMSGVAKMLNSLESQSILNKIQAQFGEMKQGQDYLSVSKMIMKGNEPNKSKVEPMEINTQEFFKETVKELEYKIMNAKNKQDLEDLMRIVLEVFNMRSEDLRDTVPAIISQIIEEEKSKGDSLRQENLNALKDIEEYLISGDLKEINSLVEYRGNFLESLRKISEEITNRVESVKLTASKYLSELKVDAEKLIAGEYRQYLPVEDRTAFKNSHSQNGLVIKEATIELVNSSNQIIEDLQGVVAKYDSLAVLDTSIIESQQKLVDTLSTQRVIERVEYISSLSSKITLIVSPTPNLGVSTLLKVFSLNWGNILALDFRKITSNPDNYKTMTSQEFISSDINFTENYVKVNDQLALDLDSYELKNKLEIIEDSYDSILIIVDSNFNTCLDIDLIQRIIYLSDTSEKNLLEINKIVQMYEPLLDNLRRRMLVINKMTFQKKQQVKELAVISGCDLTKVKLNSINLSIELVDNEESAYKEINSKFNYF